MQTSQNLQGIMIIGVIAAFILAGTDAQKIYQCCTKVSTAKITGPITGYRMQPRDPPCVRAVIFETENGEFCIHVKQAWVINKILQFERSRGNTIAPISSGPHKPTGSTVSPSPSTESRKYVTGTGEFQLKEEVVELTSPSNEAASPVNEWTSPPSEEASPVNEWTSPPNEAASPVNEWTSPPNEEAGPVNEWTSPSNEEASSVNDWTSPPNEEASPVNEWTSPPNEEASPVNEWTSPANELTSLTSAN